MVVQMQVAYHLFRIQIEDRSSFDAQTGNQRACQWIANLMMVLLQGLNVFWFYKMVLGIQRVLTKGMSEATGGSRDSEMIEKIAKEKEGKTH